LGRISHKTRTVIGITLDRGLLKAVDQARNPFPQGGLQASKPPPDADSEALVYKLI